MAEHSKKGERKSTLVLAIYFPKARILGAFGLHFLGGIGLYLG